jgi:C1A family cysteine protease
MPNAFLQDLAQKAQLSDTELAILTAADVRSAEDVDSLLSSYPSLASVGVRLPDISNSVASLLRSNYATLASDTSLSSTTLALGAAPPDDTQIALGMEVPMLQPGGASAIAGPGDSALTAPNIDLRLANWPVRDQGGRGTCVAFGSTACVEHLCATNASGSLTDLSEEFLYWAIKDHSNDPDKTSDGTWLRYARDMLKSDGICAESFWAYDGTPVTPVSGATSTDPSDDAKSDAGNRELSANCTESSPSGAARLICRLLQQNNRPVAGCFPVFKDKAAAADGPHGWGTTVARLYGRILNPPPTSVVAGGHCVCVTGFVPDSDEPMGGYFVFRNSWGSGWSRLSPSDYSYVPEQGYGQISATYVNKYCWELMQL